MANLQANQMYIMMCPMWFLASLTITNIHIWHKFVVLDIFWYLYGSDAHKKQSAM